ncbi:MAG: 4-hydroxybenzoate octaprenyltransferase [Verrucomicrobia bacterium]|nr:4-hydroxybenzoate octaprenyltransferase [Verrucomicrobiota bacterium]
MNARMNLATFDRLVLIKSSVFGAPYTLAGALLPFAAGQARPVGWFLWMWVLLAFFSLRFAGMAFNHLVDREIDAKNPRTSQRPLPLDAVRLSDVRRIVVFASLLFIFSCAMINGAVFALSPLPLLIALIYPYTKRWTSFCHLVLGSVLMMGPIMGYAAISGTVSFAALFLGLASCLSIVGNDIIYACQDIAFDRKEGLHSLPARLGPFAALLLARLMFSGAIVAMTAVGWKLELPILYYLGPLGATATFYYYDRVLKRGNIQVIPTAFFRCNALFSLWALVGVVGALIWHMWL